MGFWQGVNEGLTYNMEKKALREEKQQALDLRKQERAEDRQYESDMFMKKIAEERKTALFELALKRKQDTTLSAELTGKATSFLGRLEGVDDPRVAALANSPAMAAALEDKIVGIQEAAANAGQNVPLLQGEALLDLLTVYDSGAGTVAPVDITYEDIASSDYSNAEDFYRTAEALSAQPRGVYATLNPEASRMYDPKSLEEGRKAFDQEVLRAASQELAAVKDDPTASSDLRALMDGYSKENSAERFALMDRFGPQAFASLANIGNPYVQNLAKDPQLSRYSAVWQLQGVLTDPEATPEEKAKAQELLGRFQ